MKQSSATKRTELLRHLDWMALKVLCRVKQARLKRLLEYTDISQERQNHSMENPSVGPGEGGGSSDCKRAREFWRVMAVCSMPIVVTVTQLFVCLLYVDYISRVGEKNPTNEHALRADTLRSSRSTVK